MAKDLGVRIPSPLPLWRDVVEASAELGALLDRWRNTSAWDVDRTLQQALYGHRDEAFLWGDWMFWLAKASDMADVVRCVRRSSPVEKTARGLTCFPGDTGEDD